MQHVLPLAVLPEEVVIYLVNSRGLTLHFEGTFGNAHDAELFAGGAADLKERGIAALQNLPQSVKIKPDTLRQFTKALASVKFDAKERTVTSTLTLSADLQRKLEAVLLDLLKSLSESAGKGR
jgi:hypothetical protein